MNLRKLRLQISYYLNLQRRGILRTSPATGRLSIQGQKSEGRIDLTQDFWLCIKAPSCNTIWTRFFRVSILMLLLPPYSPVAAWPISIVHNHERHECYPWSQHQLNTDKYMPDATFIWLPRGMVSLFFLCSSKYFYSQFRFQNSCDLLETVEKL